MSTEVRPCRACGMILEFRIGPNGKTIPLQRVRAVYGLTDDGAIAKASAVFPDGGMQAEAVYVSHFETCYAASRFSRKRESR